MILIYFYRFLPFSVFWYDLNTANFLINDGAVSLVFYVDGQLIGSQAASVYWTSAPNCEQTGIVSVTMFLGSFRTQDYNYEIKDQTGWTYWSGVITISANQCTTYQL